MFRELVNHYLIKLKTQSLYKELINNLFVISFGIIILLFSVNHYYSFILFFIYFLFIYRKNKRIAKILFWLSFIIIVSYFLHLFIIHDKSYDTFNGVIINISKKESYNKIILKKGLIKVIVYDYDFLDLEVGDYLTVIGTNSEITISKIPNGFNYQNYYYSQGIVSIIKAKNIEKETHFNLYYLKRIIYRYINKTFNDEAKSFILGMVLGDTSYLAEDAMDAIRINSISHLFAISGLHISLLVSLLSKVLSKIIKEERKIENIIIITLLIYLIITNFQVSILRASSMYILSVINKRFDLKLNSLDIISIVFLALIIINPWYMYYLSFVLSFSAAFVIILISSTFSKYNVKLNSAVELALITLLLQLATLPITINVNNSFNILSIITNVIFITLVTTIILPITFVVLLLPFLKIPYEYLIHMFNNLNIFFAKYISININLPTFNHFEILIYYLLIIILLSIYKTFNKKIKILFIGIFILFFGLYLNKINTNLNGKIYFLSLYEGDCTVIDLPLNKGIVVIDTGKESDNVLSFLKSIGVRKIDYLIITHNHSDHFGNAKQIINELNVKYVAVNKFDKTIYNAKMLYLGGGDEINLNGYQFNILSPNIYSSEENDNSLVIYTKLGNYNYLFLGDASKKIEEKLINYQLDVDVVKVSHHGSNTSTSAKFYQSINPSCVVIMTGENKKFNFPNSETINILSSYKIYRTDLDYSICFRFNKRKTKIKTCN